MQKLSSFVCVNPPLILSNVVQRTLPSLPSITELAFVPMAEHFEPTPQYPSFLGDYHAAIESPPPANPDNSRYYHCSPLSQSGTYDFPCPQFGLCPVQTEENNGYISPDKLSRSYNSYGYEHEAEHQHHYQHRNRHQHRREMSADKKSGEGAPNFGPTNQIEKLYSTRGQLVTPKIIAKIGSNFFRTGDPCVWTCYRRNYISVDVGFQLNQMLETPLALGPLADEEAPRPVRGFSMVVSATAESLTGGRDEVRGLIQHTPKRDKASAVKPSLKPVSPSFPASPAIPAPVGPSAWSNHHQLDTHRHGPYESRYTQQNLTIQPPMKQSFERIHFENATQNNGHRRAQQQFYHLVVELHAHVDHGEPVKIAEVKSDRLVVRGRSPGHYGDGPRSHGPNRRGAAPGRARQREPQQSLPSLNQVLDNSGPFNNSQYGSQGNYQYDQRRIPEVAHAAYSADLATNVTPPYAHIGNKLDPSGDYHTSVDLPRPAFRIYHEQSQVFRAPNASEQPEGFRASSSALSETLYRPELPPVTTGPSSTPYDRTYYTRLAWTLSPSLNPDSMGC